MSLSDRLTCPFCPPHKTVARPLGDLERHIGLKYDALHNAWREKHGLPADINLHNIKKYRQGIRIAIIQDWDSFKPKAKK